MNKPNNHPYTYVFIRSDLSVAQQIVQSSHATHEAGFKYDRIDGPNHIVLCGVQDEEELLKVSEYISHKGAEHIMFFETSIDQYTALASKPMVGDERKAFRKYELYCPIHDQKEN